MRILVLSVKSLAILGAVTIGVVLAQENMRPPAAGQTRSGQPSGSPTAPAQAAAPPVADAATYRQQISYVIGRQFGDGLRVNDVPLDTSALIAGVNDGLMNAKARWTDAELMAAMQRFEREMSERSAARQQQIVAKNKQQADAFLAANRLQQGVQVTPSGLQYKVLAQGNGPSPTRADVVSCNYRGTFLSGEEFDSSQRHGGPAKFQVGGVLPGWTEALQKMKVGDKWQLFIPTELAYGNDPDPRSGIEPGAMLIFEVELLEIVK
jgi:FKBP-type peptidyl-prolyl cis-trans isomerase FklB